MRLTIRLRARAAFRLTCVFLVLASSALAPFGGKAGTIDVILVEGDSLPDGPGTLYSLSAPLLGDSGQLLINAQLDTHDLGFQDAAIYRGGAGTPLVSVARTGQVIDGDALLSTHLSGLAINARDEVAFSASPTGVGNGLYFFDDALGARRLAGPGTPMPDAGGGSILGFLNWGLLNDSGQVVRGANAGAGSAYLSADGGTGLLQTVARTGQPAPDGPGILANLGSSFSLNDAGQVAFSYNVTEGGVFTDILTLRADPTPSGFELIELARSGEPAPGSTGAFVSSGGASLNANGQVAFTAVLDVATTGTPGSTNDRGMYLYDDVTGLQEVVSFSGSSSTFRAWRAPVLNASGQIAFAATLRDTPTASDEAMVLFENGAPHILAREGDPVPGGDGVFWRFGTNSPVALNDAGQVAFMGELLGVSGSESVLVRALYRYSESEGLVELVRAGAPLLGSTIRSLDFQGNFGNADLNSVGLNASGQVAFSFVLADGRVGAAVWSEGDEGSDPLVAITSPAPGSVVAAEEILVEGVASDDGEVAEVRVNGIEALLVSTANPDDPAEVAFSARVPLAPGVNVIEAIALDDEGRTATQSLAIEFVPAPEPLLCDANGDGVVDRSDIGAIFAARGSSATGPDDPRDVNRDGRITVNDGRLCALQCTNPRCAPAAF